MSVALPFSAPLNNDLDAAEAVVAVLALELEVLGELVIAKCLWVEYAGAQNLVPLLIPLLELTASPCFGRKPSFGDFGLGGSAGVNHLCCAGTGDGTPAVEWDSVGLRGG